MMMRLNEFIPKSGEVQRLYCSECGDPTVLTFQTFDETFQGVDEDLDGIRIAVEGLPMLHCDRCGSDYFPDRSKGEICAWHYDSWNKGNKGVSVKLIRMNDNFGLTKIPFIYDPRDYYYIPGLCPCDGGGFLTPVFFDKKVLIYFHNDPDYVVDFCAKTYGWIHKGIDHGLCFGINRNGKVIMWLGDIATLPESAQYLLKGHNIESDHDIGSEFYDAQIECKSTEPTPEDRLMEARSNFHHAALQLFGKKLSQLDAEVLELIKELRSPIVFDERENKDVIDILHKLNIEALDSKNLKRLLQERDVSEEEPRDIKSLKSLEKLYEIEFPEAPIRRTLSALHALYNLRVALLHFRSGESRVEEIRAAASLIGIKRKRIRFEIIYPILLDNITRCYEKLYRLTASRLD